MNTPETRAGALEQPPRPAGFTFTEGPGWWLVVAVTTVLTARLSMESIQLGCTITLLVLTVGLYMRSRSAGLVAAWLIWLVAPFLRRVIFLSEPTGAADPLALAPFLVTAAIVVLEYRRANLSRRSRQLLLTIVVGYAIGIPTGISSPTSAAFALFAYLTAAGCFVIGYRDAEVGRWLSWPTLLMIVTPVLALYAFQQYFTQLPIWDEVWRKTAEIGTVGSPDEGRIRVWGTLNSPGTFGLVLGIAAVAMITARRYLALRLVALLLILGALAITYVRSAWISLVVAIVLVAIVTRGGAIKQIAPVALILVVLAPIVFGGSAGAALTDRVDTLGAVGSDESAQARVATPTALVPVAASRPLGIGLGKAGEASRLSDAGGFRYTDNGYLSLLFQVGPFGFLLVMAAALTAFARAWRNAWRVPDSSNVVVFGILSFLLVMLLTGDAFYGIGGMIFWFACGVAFRRDEMMGAAPT
jgi:putative inorganic carbon (HCO3(-)) transporter